MGKTMVKRAFTAFLLALLLSACATQSPPPRSGSQNAASKGAFRGRWWSYYERGSTHLAAGRFEQAEADFVQALRGRSRDAWQARTYGLHFVEYFPNRELGVAYYQLGRLDEAQSSLEQSLEQMDTARAHLYLDLIAKARIAQGQINDAGAPSVSASLQDGALISQRELPLQVQATDDVGVSCVMVNGQLLPQRRSAESVAFERGVLFTEGPQEVTLEAMDLADKAASSTVRVEVDFTGPTIGIFTPADAAVVDGATTSLSGTCVDKNGVVAVRLDDRLLAQSKGDTRLDFSAELPLRDGENSFVLSATDRAGNETRTAVRVFQGKPGSAAAQLWRVKERAPHRLELASASGVMPWLWSELCTAADEEPIAIRLKSPQADRPYRHNKTLGISGEVLALTKVTALEINGEPFESLTGAPKETFSKRIPLDIPAESGGEKTVSLKLAARDDAGHETTQALEVRVRPVFLDSRESKMPVAVLAFAGNGVDPAQAALLRTSAEAQLFERGRFRVLDRTRLQDVLTEQQLAAALADPNEAISLGKLTNAHVFLVADVFPRDEKGLEIKARVISAETSDIVATLDAFITDKDNADEVKNACAALADQLEKAFPRLSGEILSVREKADGSEMLVNWTKEDGVHEGMYLVVVHEDQPWIDESTGEVLAPGEILEVSRGRIVGILSTGARAQEVKRENQDVKLEQGMAAVTM